MSNFIKEFFSVKMITLNAIVAALYATLTIVCYPLSYGFMQIRFSELLNLLVFFNPSFFMGVTLGCLLANLFSSAGMIDVILGTLVTLISSILMILLSKCWKNLFFNGLIPSILNALVVPFIIYLASLGSIDEMSLSLSSYFIMASWVFLGEFISINIVGYTIFMIFKKTYPKFYETINNKQDLARVKW